MSITFESVFSLLPNCESVGGDVICRLESGKRVVVGSLRSGVFNLTVEGFELTEGVKEKADEPEASRKGRPRKTEE
jgi:hypothetical protein